MAKVEIYSSMLCPYCRRAKQLLTSKGVEFTEIDVMQQPLRKREMIQRTEGARTVPQIFIDGAHIGGCDDLYDLDGKGGLDPLLQTVTGSHTAQA